MSDLTIDQIRRLDQAERKIASTNPRIRERGHVEALNVATQHQHRQESARDDERAAEVIQLATIRNESVVTAERGAPKTRIRNLSQDGLELLYSGGAITKRHRDAGLIFRAAYEACDPAMVGAYGERTSGDADPHRAAMVRAKASIRRAAIMVLCATPRERTALEEVVGKGRTVRAVTKGGSAYGFMITALRQVLARIAERYM